MKVDLTKTINDFDGNPINGLDGQSVQYAMQAAIKVYEEIHGKGSASDFIKKINEQKMELDLTIGAVCKKVLSKGLKGDSEDKTFEHFLLGTKCIEDKPDLSDDERSEIKRVVNKIDTVEIVNQFRPIIAGNIAQEFESKK